MIAHVLPRRHYRHLRRRAVDLDGAILALVAVGLVLVALLVVTR